MIHHNYYAVIMAGGIGSRFWPFSRTSRPKQFLDILGVGKTLLQMTYDRLSLRIPPENIYVVTGESYQDLTRTQLPQIKKDQILLEPYRRNTAPCIAFATREIIAKNPNAIIFVAPSDHLILDQQTFLTTIDLAFKSAESHDHLITIGIQPSRPDINYGYIEIDQRVQRLVQQKVVSFKEKPDVRTAEYFVAQNKYLWNSGMFCWSAKTIQTALKIYAPEIFAAFAEHKNSKDAFEASPAISIDYAVMEKSDNVYVIPSEFGWSDLGTWESLYDLSPKDQDGNVVDSTEAHLSRTTNCTIKSHRTVVCDSVDNLLIVDTPDILLVCKRDDARFKEIASELSKKY